MADGGHGQGARALATLQTKRAIIAAAKHLFTALHYDDVTIRSIAARASLSTGAIYANWPNKEALYAEAMGQPAPRDSALTRAAPDMKELLTEACDAYRDRQHPGWLERAEGILRSVAQ